MLKWEQITENLSTTQIQRGTGDMGCAGTMIGVWCWCMMVMGRSGCRVDVGIYVGLMVNECSVGCPYTGVLLWGGPPWGGGHLSLKSMDEFNIYISP